MEAHKLCQLRRITDDYNRHVTLNLHQMPADMRDVAFWYRKKTGIPKMSDSGLDKRLLIQNDN
jgi:hypothetical protein